jgi:class 3 adenylate cyclase/TolB-like protein
MTSNPVSRRLSAIVVADVVGYTRLMERDETGTHARLKEIRAQVVDPRIAAHGGRIINTSGDGMLVEFGSATAALRCAIEIQREMGTRNLYVAPEERIEFRIGINLGDIIIDGDDIAGEGVNVAARLETLAQPGGICIAATVLEHAHEDLGVAFIDIGEQQVKNIVRPIRVYRVTLGKSDTEARAATRPSPQQRSTRRRWLLAGVAALGAIGLGIILVQQLMKSPMAPARPPNSVAILPFTVPANSPAEEQLADLITQDLTAALGRSRLEQVASPGLAAVYKGKPVDARSAGRELNVRYLTEGDVRPESDRNVVSIRLVDALSGLQVWSDQNEVRKSADKEERAILVLRMKRRLGNALYDAQRNDPNQSAVMKLFFRADNINASSREHVMEARRLFDEALRLQPDHELALIGRGWNSVSELEFDPGPDRERLVEEALEFSARAIAIDPDHAVAWDLRGVALGWQGRLDAAFEADKRARQLDPSMGFNVRAWLLVMNGQANEALAVIERAFSIDPQAIGNYQAQKCWASLQLGRYDEAIAACEKWRAVDDQWFFPHVLLMAAYAQSGNAAKAAAEKAIVLQRVPEYSIARYKALWKSDSPAYQTQTEAHILAGLRKAGIPEQ